MGFKDQLGDTPFPAPSKAFDGRTYDADRDFARLGAQLRRVLTVMQSGSWMSLSEIARETGDPEASVSARLRDLKKSKFGGREVESEYVTRGKWRYRLKGAA